MRSRSRPAAALLAAALLLFSAAGASAGAPLRRWLLDDDAAADTGGSVSDGTSVVRGVAHPLPPRRAFTEPARPRVVGGQTVAAADRQLYSFAVLLKVRFASGSYQCGGTLIAPGVVLTAAHCVAVDPHGTNASDTGAHAVTALLGWQDTRNYVAGSPVPATEPSAEVLAAARWTWHELFNASAASGVVNAHDIAVVWLAADSVHASPAPLDFPPGGAASAGPQGLALGWGITRALRVDDEIAGATATKLQRVRVALAAGAYCDTQATANANEYDDTRQVCSATDGGFDTCYGDSGGPLLSIAASADNWAPGILFGIVSYGYGCAVPGYYSVYTRVSCYMPWLLARVPSLSPPAPTVEAVAAAAEAAAAAVAPPALQAGGAQIVAPMRVVGVAVAAAGALPAAVQVGLASALAQWGVQAANVTVATADVTLPLRLGFAAAPLAAWNANVSKAVAAAAALDLGITASRLHLGCAAAAIAAATPVQAPPSAAGRRLAAAAAPEVLLPMYVSGFGADAAAAAALAARAAASAWPRTLAALASEAKLNVTPPTISTAATSGAASVSLSVSVAMPAATPAQEAAATAATAALGAASLSAAIGAALGSPLSVQAGSASLTVGPAAPAAPAAVEAPGFSGKLVGVIIGAAGGGVFALAACIAFVVLRRARLKRRHAEAAEAIAAGVPLAALLSRPSMAGFPAEALRAAQQRAAELNSAEKAAAPEPASADIDADEAAYEAALRRSKAAPRVSESDAGRPPRVPRRSMPNAPVSADDEMPRYMRPRTSAPRYSQPRHSQPRQSQPRFSSHALSTRGSESSDVSTMDPRAPRRSQLWSIGIDGAAPYTDSDADTADGDAATPGDMPQGRRLPRWSMQAAEGEAGAPGQPRSSRPRYSRPRMSAAEPAPTHREEDEAEAEAEEEEEEAPPRPYYPPPDD